MSEVKSPKKRWSPSMTGLAVSVVSAAVLFAASPAGGGAISGYWFIPLFCILSGTFATLFQEKRLHALLAGLFIGLASGIMSSFSLIGQPVEGLFSIVALTMSFFFVTSLMLGAFVECVLFLHHIAHGRAPGKYGNPPKE